MIRHAVVAFVLALAATLPAAAASPSPKPVTLADGLIYTDIVVGRGAPLRQGRTAIVHYVGTFPDGHKFDSSRDRKEAYSFRVGGHRVIACWDEGVASMRVGGRRKLVCPPALAYGDRGAAGVIPPNATLHFDVELLAVR